MSIGERLTLARQAVGMTQDDLAEEVALTREELADFEAVYETPDDALLCEIADALDIDPVFLVRRFPVTPVQPISPYFDDLDDDAQTILIAQARIWVDRYLDLESYDPARILSFDVPGAVPSAASSGAEAAEAAILLREAWGLGSQPVRSMVELLEDRGIRVGLVDVPHDGFTACALVTVDPALPLIVSGQHVSGQAQRFALARELGHLVLNDLSARDAGHFAAAFLMPADAVKRDLGAKCSDLDEYELILLKDKYGMPASCVVARLATLGTIKRDVANGWFDTLDERRHDAFATGPDQLLEVPGRAMRLVWRLKAENVLDQDDALDLLMLPWMDANLIGDRMGEAAVG